LKRTNLLLLLAVAALAIVPLLMPNAKPEGERFTGTDDQARRLIQVSHPDYLPWFKSLWSPPSGQIESLLFSLQAALGAGVMGYYFGLIRGRSETRPLNKEDR
jgi:cobalt/nickel transport protein